MTFFCAALANSRSNRPSNLSKSKAIKARRNPKRVSSESGRCLVSSPLNLRTQQTWCNIDDRRDRAVANYVVSTISSQIVAMEIKLQSGVISWSTASFVFASMKVCTPRRWISSLLEHCIIAWIWCSLHKIFFRRAMLRLWVAVINFNRRRMVYHPEERKTFHFSLSHLHL